MSETLKSRLQTDLKTAMKARDADRRDAIRLLVAEMKNREIDLKRDLTSDEEVKMLQTQAKQRQDAIEQFRAGDREDLVERDSGQLAVIESYLPSQMSDDDLSGFVEEGVREIGAEGPKDMGKVMGLLGKRADGRVDGRRLSDAVKRRLAT